MATITSWAGTVTDIGPLYPFVGSEVLMVVGAAAFWIIWHILQTRQENQEYQGDLEKLRAKEAFDKAIDHEG